MAENDIFDPLTGELVPTGKNSENIHVDVNPIDLTNLLDMPRHELQKLLQRVSQAGWGYGKLTGKELLETALKTKDEAYEALKLTALTLAINASDWREFNALATFWAEREKGKPSQSVDVTGKIGIVQIVLEAAKQRKSLLVDSSPILDGVISQAIDNLQ